ncbi:MAG: NUDIX hydrolase [Chitinophagaceae bacterium]
MNDSVFHPFNVFKYCPFCGSKSFSACEEKSLQCRLCKKKFYINMSAATVAIIENEYQELLLVERKYNPAKGKLDLPGGFVDIGETAEQAIIREVKEEVNLEVEQVFFLGSFPNEYLFGGVLYFTLDMLFRCKVKSFDAIVANDDANKFLFLSAEKIYVEDIGLRSIKHIIQQYKDNR